MLFGVVVDVVVGALVGCWIGLCVGCCGYSLVSIPIVFRGGVLMSPVDQTGIK